MEMRIREGLTVLHKEHSDTARARERLAQSFGKLGKDFAWLTFQGCGKPR